MWLGGLGVARLWEPRVVQPRPERASTAPVRSSPCTFWKAQTVSWKSYENVDDERRDGVVERGELLREERDCRVGHADREVGRAERRGEHLPDRLPARRRHRRQPDAYRPRLAGAERDLRVAGEASVEADGAAADHLDAHPACVRRLEPCGEAERRAGRRPGRRAARGASGGCGRSPGSSGRSASGSGTGRGCRPSPSAGSCRPRARASRRRTSCRGTGAPAHRPSPATSARRSRSGAGTSSPSAPSGSAPARKRRRRRGTRAPRRAEGERGARPRD